MRFAAGYAALALLLSACAIFTDELWLEYTPKRAIRTVPYDYFDRSPPSTCDGPERLLIMAAACGHRFLIPPGEMRQIREPRQHEPFTI